MAEGIEPQPNCITPKYISSILFPGDITRTGTIYIGINWIPSNVTSAKIVRIVPFGTTAFDINIPLIKTTSSVIPLYYFDGDYYQYDNKLIKEYCNTYSTIAIIELTY